MNIFNVGFLLMKSVSFHQKKMTNHTQDKIHAPQHHSGHNTGVYKHLACIMVRSALELCVMERMAAQGLGTKKINEALGLTLSKEA